MLLINLIAAQREERRKLEKARGLLIRLMAGVALGTVMAVIWLGLAIRTTREQITDADLQIAALQDTVSRVEQLQASMAALEPRVQTLINAQNATNKWRAVLQEVGSSLPESTWITSFSSSGDGGNEGFSFSGQTVSQEKVGATMLRLNKAPIVSGVDLRFTTRTANEPTVTFEIGGALETLGGESDAE